MLLKQVFIIKNISICKIFKRKIHNKNVRVRFAPSPTGYLHLGGLRTALYNYLFAKQNHGQFIVRIEDTDQTRLVQGASEQLIKDLLWVGIEIDEGLIGGVNRGNYGPYLQSDRLSIYKNYVQRLLDNGSAYHCFCTDKRLQLLRREAVKLQQVPKYDNRCRHLAPEDVKRRLNRNETSCIRFKISDKDETFNDLIYGPITYNISLNEGDPVIMKSDGFPTYHFANVVDDHLMEISHVFRGVEWQISTTKHILMYRAFGWEAPHYGHLPLLLNADGTKLSKRQNDIRINEYRQKGILPLALINFIVHSGGGFDKDLETGVQPKIYTIDQLAKQFNVSGINSHSGKLMPERLFEFNRLEIQRQLQRESETQELVRHLQQLILKSFSERDKKNLKLDSAYITSILKWSQNRITSINDLVSEKFEFIWKVPPVYEISDKNLVKILDKLILELSKKLELIETMQILNQDLNSFLKEFAAENNIKFGFLMKILRQALSGLKEGPGVVEIIEILGKNNTLERLQNCIDYNKSVDKNMNKRTNS